MIKNDVEFKWMKVENEAFKNIKTTVIFPLYYASHHCLVVVLMQKDLEGKERPIYFMSTNSQGVELNYPTIDQPWVSLPQIVP
jgi:hypothetical protein